MSNNKFEPVGEKHFFVSDSGDLGLSKYTFLSLSPYCLFSPDACIVPCGPVCWTVLRQLRQRPGEHRAPDG